ncbi:unnamed protein product [Hymenolepis diminuta]|uniref:Secreted protein n=1 Tax=Hymenolepis diminuta TaxID=6216 RepID=A0A0R3SAT4_HYMDI|nr:unnamed protein product [Hymenolepis diminuta]
MHTGAIGLGLLGFALGGVTLGVIGAAAAYGIQKMADLEAVLADVSYLMAMEMSKSTPAARASKKITLPDSSSCGCHSYRGMPRSGDKEKDILGIFIAVGNAFGKYDYLDFRLHL